MKHYSKMLLMGTVAETYNGEQFDMLVGDTYINVFVPDFRQDFAKRYIAKGKNVFVEGSYTDQGGSMPGCQMERVEFL